MTILPYLFLAQLAAGCLLLWSLSKNKEIYKGKQLSKKNHQGQNYLQLDIVIPSKLMSAFLDLEDRNNQKKIREHLISENFSIKKANKIIAETIIRTAIRSIRFRVHNKCIPYRNQIRKRESVIPST